jgi:hypothetical protein
MMFSSSQRWAIGAVSLAVLIACSPQPATPASADPTPDPASAMAETAAPSTVPEVAERPTMPPGYAGAWALKDSECGDSAKTFRLGGDVITMAPGDRSCDVASIEEEHPSGRSMIYHIKASCLGPEGESDDQFTFNFGASDTVMQFKLNDREPMRLVRCPP